MNPSWKLLILQRITKILVKLHNLHLKLGPGNIPLTVDKGKYEQLKKGK